MIFTITKVLIVAVFGIILGLLAGRFILYHIMLPLAIEIVKLGGNSYLNGFQVWEFQRNQTFNRLGQYIGHGLCYEASAILMLILKDHWKSRFVYGEALFRSKHKSINHCWVEIKAYGIWWALDSVWLFPVYPIPTLAHRILTKTYAVRKISDRDFFSHKIATQMVERIKDPKTSYIFHDLVCFRRAYWENKTKNAKIMVVEADKEWQLITKNEPGCWNFFLIDVFKVGRPVTRKIITEFLTNDRRTLPKRRTFRKALVLEKTIKRCKEEAKALHEKTGNEIVIELIDLKTFKFTEIAPQ